MPSFSETELSLALSEVGWGLTAWELLPPPSPPHETRAKLDLLEPNLSATVSVSERGWSVLGAEEEGTFETLEQLLADLSPRFEARRIKLLTDSLKNISVRRDWGEGDGLEEAEAKPEEEGATLASS